MKTLLTLLLLLATPAWSQSPAGSARAVQAPGNDVSKFTLLVTSKGQEFHDVTVTNATAGTIKLYHRDGIATLGMTEMPAEVQKMFGYDPTSAAFEAVNMVEEKRRAAEALAQSQAERVKLQAQQARESKEISAIDAQAFIAEAQVTEHQTNGCTATVSALAMEAVPGQKNFSGQPVMRLVKRRTHTAFIHGLSGSTPQIKLYPVPSSPAEYATSGAKAWRVNRDREIEAERVKAEQAAKLLAQRKAIEQAREANRGRAAKEREARAAEQAAAEAN